MLIRHLTYFIALAREQHFARAAKACSVTQNLTHASFELAQGYPEAGRNLHVRLRLHFLRVAQFSRSAAERSIRAALRAGR